MFTYILVAIAVYGIFSLPRRLLGRPVKRLYAHILGPMGGAVGIFIFFLMFFALAFIAEAKGTFGGIDKDSLGRGVLGCLILGWYSSVRALRKPSTEQEAKKSTEVNISNQISATKLQIPTFKYIRDLLSSRNRLKIASGSVVFFLAILIFYPVDSNESKLKADPTKLSTYHTDSRYKYNHRTRGDNYNYDVSGYSEDGEYSSGTIDIDSSENSGSGYIEVDGEERYVSVEWTGQGELEAEDEYGNYYELEVD